MDFDRFTVSILILRPDGPAFTDDELDELQDAHLAHLASLRDSGELLASGPMPGAPDRRYRGLCIFGVDVDEAKALSARDPMVVAGRFEALVFPWMVPAGLISFTSAPVPRSTAEAES